MTTQKHLNILGCRGVPAQHGGFETFAERLALFLVERGWTVSVYCQVESGASGDAAPAPVEDEWRGVRRVLVSSRTSGPLQTVGFDWKCARDVRRRPGVDLVLGYNTAAFNIAQRLGGRRVVFNMDGIEWKRGKWTLPIKVWFFLNEVIAANIATRAIADHPEIIRHFSRRSRKRAVMIPYGSDLIEMADEAEIGRLGLQADRYFISIARVEPENSVLEMVRAFSREKRGMKYVVLGKLEDTNPYHRSLREAAGGEVVYPGAIYDKSTVAALRFFCRAYLHGHQVGGTNPSLVEALGAGNAVIAHDNAFNRWTAGAGQLFFRDVEDCAHHIGELAGGAGRLDEARTAARARHRESFLWEDVLQAYERVLTF